MKNLIRPTLISVLVGLALFPLACSKTFTPVVPNSSATATATPNNTSTVFATFTQTSTPTNTATATATPSGTISPVPTKTATPTFTSTNSPTSTPSNSPTNTPTITSTFTNTPTSIATALATAGSLTLTSGVTTLTTGTYYFSCVNISGSAVVTISGGVTIFTQCFTLASGATITGVGMGGVPDPNCPTMLTNSTSGNGQSNVDGLCGAVCAGGSHGGLGAGITYVIGGTGPTTCYARVFPSNDDPIHPYQVGAPGGYPADATPYNCTSKMDAGGGLLKLVVYDPGSNTLQPTTLNGTIDMSGSSIYGLGLYSEPGGFGAGGTILIEASGINGTGSLVANGGGIGGPVGGGGIISLIENGPTFAGTTSVLPGQNPGTAQSGIVSITAAPASGY